MKLNEHTFAVLLVIGILLAVALGSISVSAYTAPTNRTEVNFVLSASYTAPTNRTEVNFILGPPANDTCTYSGSGDWDIDCSDTCVITSNTAVGGNDVTISGTGVTTVQADITNWNDLRIIGTDAINICRVRCESGGCFKQ